MSLNKKSIGISALAVGLLATVAATSAGAFGGGGHCKRGGGRHGGPSVSRLEHRLEKLDLPAGVRAKAFAIIDAQRSEDRALRDQIRAAHEQLKATLETGAPDADALDAQVEALGALKTQHHKQFLHTQIEVGALLPDAQRAEWFEPRHHRGDRHGKQPQPH